MEENLIDARIGSSLHRHPNSLTLLNSSQTSTKPILTNPNHYLPPSSMYPEVRTFSTCNFDPCPFGYILFFLQFEFLHFLLSHFLLPTPRSPPLPPPLPELHAPPLLSARLTAHRLGPRICDRTRVFYPLPQELQLQLHGRVCRPHLPHEPGLLWRSRPDTLQEWTNVRSSPTPIIPRSSHLRPPARPLLQALLLPHLLPWNGPQTSDLALSLGLWAAQACPNMGHLLQEINKLKKII